MQRCVEGMGAPGSVTLVPRLEYSAGLLYEATMMARTGLGGVAARNMAIGGGPDCKNPAHRESVELERTLACCCEVLDSAAARLSRVSGIASIPDVLPPAITMIRAAAARLHGPLPACSRMLSELSVQLGSIALDSAALTGARFDFGPANAESASALDEAKLIADSKMAKRYPNLETCGDGAA